MRTGNDQTRLAFLTLPILLAATVVAGPYEASAGSVELKANGSGDTYRLINSVLAPDGNVVEAPDCGHKEFGPHITQVFDPVIDRHAFRFHIHRDEDDDRCRKQDRQRNEIKVYGGSPIELKATKRDIFVYQWMFRLPEGFQPSKGFTHLHQIKAVGGSEASMPLVTLTARKGRVGEADRMELRHAERRKSQLVDWVNLQPFLGKWVSVEERIEYGEKGKISVVIKALEAGKTLLSYSNDSIRMWKSGAEFIRPKWGIYRSLKDKGNLRDEVVDFADFRISF